jgi:tripartite-type tricarboxylate transporter receptor subunit TctC
VREPQLPRWLPLAPLRQCVRVTRAKRAVRSSARGTGARLKYYQDRRSYCSPTIIWCMNRTMKRRHFIKVVGGALFSSSANLARAQMYPSRPVHLIVGFPPGGTTDVVARVIGQWLSERLGTAFIIENKPGAGTNIATEAVVRAPGDGYTLLVITPANAINASFYDKLDFDFQRDIAPVVGLIRSPYVLEAFPGFPATTVPELIAYAKANPGKINIASFGTGTGSHLSGEMFKMATGVEMLHVPYKGSAPMLTDLLVGRVQVAFDNLPASIEQIKVGRLRALAVTTAKRSDMMPDVPTLGEFLPGYETSSWLALGAPRKTPTEIIVTLNKEINAGLADPNVKAQLAGLGATVIGGSSADTAALIAEETEKWREAVKFSGAKQN